MLKTCFTGKLQLWALQIVLILVGFFSLPYISLQIIHSSHQRYGTSLTFTLYMFSCTPHFVYPTHISFVSWAQSRQACLVQFILVCLVDAKFLYALVFGSNTCNVALTIIWFLPCCMGCSNSSVICIGET